MHDRWPITGRGNELDLISEVLARRTSAGILISGAAGVGKTRLLAEALAAAATTGWQIRRVSGTATGRALPLGALSRWAGRVRGSTTQTLERVIRAVVGHRDTRILLGVDDAHLLDDLSALVVHQLLLRGCAAVVMTVRCGDSAPDAITAPWKEGLLQYMRLEPLRRRDCNDLLAATLGSVAPECAQLVWDRTLGNASFLRHLVEADRADGQLVERDGQWCYPRPPTLAPSLQDLVLVQIGPMSDSVADVAELVAAAGSVNRHCLFQLADAPAIEEAARRGLISSPSEASNEIQIGHPLYGEALLGRCGPLRIRRLKGRLALALLSCRDAGAADPLRLGELWLGSDLAPDEEVFHAAAKAAADRLDVGAAERFAREAIRAGGGDTARIVHARTLHFLGQGNEAQHALERLGDPPASPCIADAVILRASNLLWMQRDVRAAGLVIETAMRYTVGDDVHKLRAFQALRLTLCATPGDVLELIETIDRTRLDRKGRIFVRFAETLALAHSGRTRNAMEASARDIPAPPYSVEETVLTMTLADQMVSALATAGYLAEATAAAEQFDRNYAGLSRIGRAAASAVAGLVALRRGDLGAACEQLADAIQNAEGYLENTVVAYRNLIHYTEALARRGNARAAAKAMASAEAVKLSAHAETEIAWQLGQAWMHAADRKAASARCSALRAAAAARDRGRLAQEVYCLQTAAQFGETTVAERLLELSRATCDPRCVVAARYARALATNDPVELLGASDDFEAMGDRLAAADAAGHAAVASRVAGLRGSALTASGRAMRIAHECGAVSPAIVGARVVLPLTRREREVAILVARGLSNREIGDTMSLSVRTVEGHVYQASRKAGVSTRVELARIIGEFDSHETKVAQTL